MTPMAKVTPLRPRGTRTRTGRSRPPYTAFVLSGGASLGALQVGMLRALFECGITADLFVGTSVGALNAAFVAARPQTPATAGELSRIWLGLQREDIFPVSVRTLVAGLCGQRDHLVSADSLRRQVRRYIGFQDLSEAPVPLHVVAFDVNDGREVRISRGPALDAIVAAAAVPGVFPPVAIGERLLIDAGVVNNTPISHAVELGAERIYVLPTQERWRRPGPVPRRALDAAMYGIGLLLDGRLEADVERYSSEAELIVLPAPNLTSVQPTDFDHTSRLIGAAHAASRGMLARGDGVYEGAAPARRTA